MKKPSLLVVLAGCALLVGGCDIFGHKAANYFPLSIGSTWQYVMLEIVVTPDSTDTLSQDTMNWEAKAEAQLASGEKVVLVEVLEDGWVDSMYYRATDDFVLYYEDLQDDEPDTMLALPLEADKSWHVDEDVLAQVLGQEKRSVVAGTYKSCWKVRWTEDGDLLDDYWFAPNVGLCLVELDEEYQGTTYIERIELTAVHIK